MRRTRTIFGFVAAASLIVTPAFADHGHGPAPKPTTVAGKPTTTSGKPSADQTSVKPTTGKGGKPTVSKNTTKSTTTSNPIAAKISSKPNLNAKITAMLPAGADGKTMTLNDASKGFKNQGQFIAALHVSQNLGIPFADLKKDMTKRNMSLGQSIQDLKKSANSTTEASKAQHEADDDEKSTTPPPTTTKKDDKHSEHHESEHHEHQSVAQQITSNKALNAKVTPLLPAGMPLKDAAKGFRSESQFLAALHASKDLGIPFAQIKGEMTGNDHDSLTRAIQELKPTANATAAAKTAQQEAAADIKATAPATH